MNFYVSMSINLVPPCILSKNPYQIKVFFKKYIIIMNFYVKMSINFGLPCILCKNSYQIKLFFNYVFKSRVEFYNHLAIK